MTFNGAQRLKIHQDDSISRSSSKRPMRINKSKLKIQNDQTSLVSSTFEETTNGTVKDDKRTKTIIFGNSKYKLCFEKI